MNKFIEEEIEHFNYLKKKNWFLDDDEDLEKNQIIDLKENPLPLDNILFNDTSFHSFLSQGFCMKIPYIQDKSIEDNKLTDAVEKKISTEPTEKKGNEIKKLLFSTKKPNEIDNDEIPPPESRIDDDDGSKETITRKYFRVDDAKKHFKKAISQFATKELNSLIQNSELGVKFKKVIHLPNYKLFTSNSKELDNLDFLSFSVKKVFTYGKKDGNRQDKNEENLSRILNYKKYPEKTKKIKEFLDLTYQDVIKLFYKSSYFDQFKNSKLTAFFDEGIKKEKKISLLEDEGLLKLFNMTKKKRKRNFTSVLK